MKQQITEA